MKHGSLILLLAFWVCIGSPARVTAQEAAAAQYSLPVTELIDMPTAGKLERGQMEFSTRLYDGNGTLVLFRMGVFRGFNMGVSFGGRNIIGSGDVDWNERPEMMMAYRLINESFFLPAVNLGFSSQGFGAYNENRYQIKSRGFYAAGSKSFWVAGKALIGLHAGMGYNTTETDDKKGMDAWGGVDYGLNDNLSILLEYSLGLNDDTFRSVLLDEDSKRRGRGYLNGAVRWQIGENLALSLLMKDLLLNQKDIENFEREIRLQYYEFF